MNKNIAKLIPSGLRKKLRALLHGSPVDETEIVLKLLSKFELPSKIMIDVGAHYGSSLIPFAQRGWRIFAFEPDKENRDKLRQNLDAQNLSSVDIDSRAVSDETGWLSLYKSDVSTGISGLLNFHPSHKEADKVEVITLNSFCAEKNITKIDFLKIDTEGYDLKVLKGLDLNKYSPEVILCEFENNKTRKLNYTTADLLNHFIAFGFKWIISEWYPVVEYGRKHKWKQFTVDGNNTDDNGWGNIIAVRDKYFSELRTMTERK